MMGLYIAVTVACLLGALMILQGVTFWWQKDAVRGIGYTAGAIFLVLSISAIGVTNAVNNLLDEKIQQYGIENTIGGIEKWRGPERP